MSQDNQLLQRYRLGADESPSKGVYTVVATVANCSPLDLTPLADAVDPDALDALVTDANEPNHISFTYCGYEITVTDAEVRVLESENE